MIFEASPVFNYIDKKLSELWRAKRAGFIGEDREAFIRTLANMVLNSETPFVLVEGDPGAGKSAVAAMLSDNFNAGDGRLAPKLIRYAFSLAHSDLNDLKNFTEYVCGCLQKEFGVSADAAFQGDWGRRLKDCLLRATDSPIARETGRVHLLIDGLEECPDYPALLDALPRSNNIVYLLFAQPEVVKVADGPNFRKITLPFLTVETAEQILKARLGDKWRAARAIAARLLKNSRNLNPLILTAFAEEFRQCPNMAVVWWGNIHGLKSYFTKRAIGFDDMTRKLLGALACALGENLTSKTLAAFVNRDNSAVRKSLRTASRFVRYAPDSGGYEFRHNAWKTFARREFSVAGKQFALWSGANAKTAKVDDNRYSLHHGVRHLIIEKEWAKAAKLLTDLDFLMRRTKERGISSIFGEYAALSRHSRGAVFRDWAEFFREKGHLLFLGTKAWGSDRILFQLAWEDGEDSLVSAAAVKYAKKGKADWERMLAVRPKQKSRRKCLVIQGGKPTMLLRDGRVLAGYDDGTLRIWNAATGECKAELIGHTDEVFGVRELKDGRILSWSEDNTLRIWSAKGKSEVELEGHTDRVSEAVELSDGRILSCSLDTTLRIWNPSTGDCDAELKGHHYAVRDALELQDGRLLSWSWYGKTLLIWDAATGDCVDELKGHADRVHSAFELKDGRILSCSLDSTMRIWDAATGEYEIEFKGHAGWVEGAVVLKNGRILSWSRDNTLRLWDAATGECKTEFKGHADFVSGAVELKNGRLLSWSHDNTLRLWGASTGECETEFKGHLDEVEGAVELENGRLLSWSKDNTLRCWDAATGDCVAEYIGHTSWVQGAFELNDGRLFSWSLDKTLRIWDIGAGERKSGLNKPDTLAHAVVKLKDGRLLSWGKDKPLCILDASTGACAVELKGHAGHVFGALELKDRSILSWSKDKTLRVWDASDGACKAKLEGHTDYVYGAAQLKDHRIFSWSKDKTLRIWDAASEECKAELEGHAESVTDAIELKDRRILSWAWLENVLRIWDASTGEFEMKLKGHTSWIFGAIELRDGRILSWSRDADLRIWDADGECAAVLEGHTCAVGGAVELKNGGILSWSADKTMRLWDVATGDCISEFAEDISDGRVLDDGRVLLWDRDCRLRIWNVKDKGLSPVVWFGAARPSSMWNAELSFPLTGSLRGNELTSINLVPATVKQRHVK